MTYLHCSVHSTIPRISKLHPYGPALLLKHSSLSLCFWGGSQSVTPQLPPPHTHTPPHTLKEPHTFLPAALSAQLLGCYLPLHTAPSWRAFPPAVMEASLDRPLSVTHRPFQTIARREKKKWSKHNTIPRKAAVLIFSVTENSFNTNYNFQLCYFRSWGKRRLCGFQTVMLVHAFNSVWCLVSLKNKTESEVRFKSFLDRRNNRSGALIQFTTHCLGPRLLANLNLSWSPRVSGWIFLEKTK